MAPPEPARLAPPPTASCRFGRAGLRANILVQPHLVTIGRTASTAPLRRPEKRRCGDDRDRRLDRRGGARSRSAAAVGSERRRSRSAACWSLSSARSNSASAPSNCCSASVRTRVVRRTARMRPPKAPTGDGHQPAPTAVSPTGIGTSSQRRRRARACCTSAAPSCAETRSRPPLGVSTVARLIGAHRLFERDLERPQPINLGAAAGAARQMLGDAGSPPAPRSPSTNADRRSNGIGRALMHCGSFKQRPRAWSTGVASRRAPCAAALRSPDAAAENLGNLVVL